jgi:hypothetical protein
MGVMSIKDYARARKITYEAARQQVKRYEKELQGHIHKQNRTQYLDDYAVELLDDHRQQNPVVVVNQDRDAELEQLRSENKTLLQQVAMLQDKLLTAQESAIEAAKQTVLLDAAQADKATLLQRVKELEVERDEARQEAAKPWYVKLFRG